MRATGRITALLVAIVISFGVITFGTSSPVSAWWSSTSMLQSPVGGQAMGRGTVARQIVILPNGNYVVGDFLAVVNSVNTAGAVSLFDGSTHQPISTLTGSVTGDQVGDGGIFVLPGTSNYVVVSRVWDNGATVDAGAVTWCNGATGCTGTINATNSLVGASREDGIAMGVTVLDNGHYVVTTPNWDNGAVANVGASRWCNGATGCTGTIDATNSLVGTTSGDGGSLAVTALSDNNYVVTQTSWDNGASANVGAVTWCSGTTGCTGAVAAPTSLIGTTASDQVGSGGVRALEGSGKYVVSSPNWDNGATTNVGAVTLCSGANGCNGSTVTTVNSLTGTLSGDSVGTGTVSLANGDFVVRNTNWDNGATTNVGAITLCSGATGCAGSTVSPTNSLIGTTANDQVGGGVEVLTGTGRFIVRSPNWDNGTTADVGAVTLCDGTTGCAGLTVSAANSLVGTTATDQVGSASAAALSDGDYVVRSPNWDNGTTANVGAVTWCNGTTGCTGTINAANSLIGTTANDQVGSNGLGALSGNGHYAVLSANWDNGATTNVGAVTWCNGTTGCTGTIDATNSLIGTTANDSVGSNGLTALPDGNFVVTSASWYSAPSAQTGGVTWVDGSTAGPRTVGPLTLSNTVPGISTSLRVGGAVIHDAPRNKIIVPSYFLPADRILVITLGAQQSTTSTTTQSSSAAPSTTVAGTGGTGDITPTSTTSTVAAVPSTTATTVGTNGAGMNLSRLPATGNDDSQPWLAMSILLVVFGIAIRHRHRHADS